MTTPERGLFDEALDAVNHGNRYGDKLREVCLRFEQRLAEAEANSRDASLRIATAAATLMQRDTEVAQLRARCGELEGLLKTKNSALKTFGRHHASCRSTYQINGVWGACSCGLDAACDAATPKPAQEQKG